MHGGHYLDELDAIVSVKFVKKENNMKRKLLCVVGVSGSGKTTITEKLCHEYGLKEVESMTTRAPRYPGETGHTFVSKEEFDKHEMVAYTLFDGNEYGVPTSMLDEADLYVIDIDGVKMLRQKYQNKPLMVVYLDISPEVAAQRMRSRGDGEAKITKRLANDARMFQDVEGLAADYVIDASRDFDAVLDDLRNIVVEHIL